MTKTNLVPWQAPAGAVHSLGVLDGLTIERGNLLCVSDRTYHVLLNLVNLDAQFRARYAVEEYDAGFVPVTEDDPEWETYRAVVEALKLEVLDMSCDVVGVLDDILEQMQLCCNQQSLLLSAIASAGNNQATETYLETHPYYDPPSNNYPPPVDQIGLCQRSWSYATNWRVANVEAHDQAVSLGQGGIGLLTVIFAAIDLPMGVVIGIAAVIAAVALEFDKETYENVLEDATPDLACAIFTADSSGEAAIKAQQVILELPALNARTRKMLASQFTNVGMDAIFDETYPIIPGMPTDCSACEEAPDMLILTAPTTPYNEEIIGEVYVFENESAAWGWSAETGGDRVQVRFTCYYDCPTVRAQFYMGVENPPADNGNVSIHDYATGQQLQQTGYFDVPESPPGSDQFQFDFEDINLEAGKQYYFSVAKQLGRKFWINRIELFKLIP